MRRTLTVEGDLATIKHWENKLGARVIFDVPADNPGGPGGPRANVVTREIHSISLEDQPESFWSTMHELGHVAHNHGGKSMFQMMLGIPDPTEPEKEAEAWTWALDHAHRPLDAAGRVNIQFSIARYLYHNEPQSQYEPALDIGPNLTRLFETIGPDFDKDLTREVFPGQVDSVDQAAEIWAKYAGDIKLAA